MQLFSNYVQNGFVIFGKRISTQKLLVKCWWLTAWVDFINIFHAHFSYESKLHSFSLITVWLCKFWQKNIFAEAAHKILMKLTTCRLKWRSWRHFMTLVFYDVLKHFNCNTWHDYGLKITILYLKRAGSIFRTLRTRVCLCVKEGERKRDKESEKMWN